VLALITFLVIIAIVLTAARVGSIALEATGMARDSAEFQARSALLGVGFTTSEAEDITGHPTRRRIVLWLMTFGNAGTVTAIGSLVLTFGGTETVQTIERSGILVVGTVVLLISVHTSLANRLITTATNAALGRFTGLDTTDFAALLRFDSDFAVTELTAHEGEWLVGKRLAELHLTSEGVVVLGIHRANGSFLGTPTGNTRIEPEDHVLAYGRSPVLRELATRARSAGDRAHEVAVDAQREFLRRLNER
jgi:hypothetical protein